MPERISGFKGEYLWELDIAEHHLMALADAIPPERYLWAPAEGARTVAAVLIHVAAGNFTLLEMVGVPGPLELYDGLEGEGMRRFLALVLKNQVLEKTITAKPDVVKMLGRSMAAVRDAFTGATAEELDRPGDFFGERTTVRRAYLRLLTHTHEHMGQLIAYVRAIGLPAPWADPMEYVHAEMANRLGGAGV